MYYCMQAHVVHARNVRTATFSDYFEWKGQQQRLSYGLHWFLIPSTLLVGIYVSVFSKD